MKRPFLVCLFFPLFVFAQLADSIYVTPRIATQPVMSDADDPAIWVHPENPGASLILGTDKGVYPEGGLFVWSLEGEQVQHIVISHPNSVDIRQNVSIGSEKMDLAVVTMRDHAELRVFRIDKESRQLYDITTEESIPVLNSTYGLALFRRPADGVLFAFVTSKDNDLWDQIAQYRLEDDGTGRIKGTLVRTFGDHTTVVEGMVVDDAKGFLYAAEEEKGVYKYYAEPDQADTSLALFATEEDLTANREGLAIYTCPDSDESYLLVSTPAQKTVRIYALPAEDHSDLFPLLGKLYTSSDKAGDGIACVSTPVSGLFPAGILVWHDQRKRRFLLFGWEQIAEQCNKLCLGYDPTTTVDSPDQSKFIKVPEEMVVSPNYPNPFNNGTRFQIQLAHSQEIRAEIFDVMGKRVKEIFKGQLDAGIHHFYWQGNDLRGALVPSGFYFLRIKIPSETHILQMNLVR
jgi:3-phytase